MNHAGNAHRVQEAPANGASVTNYFFPRRANENNNNTNNVRRRPRQVFRINYWSILAEWTSSAIALSLLCFYSYSLLTASNNDMNTLSFKLLASNVILSVYMRICYILHSASKTFVLIKEGPVDTSTLPMQSQINSFSCLMGFVEPGHFVCLCWITHISFPFKACLDLEPDSTVCTSLHITSTIFVSMWVFTGAAFIVLIVCFARWERNGGRNNGLSDTLRMSAIPDNIRESIINNLPLTHDAPSDGEVCAICCDTDPEDAPAQWRLLPCGHRFHPQCVDEWLKKQGGTCPTCRHDPVLGNPRTGPAAVEQILHGNSSSSAASADAADEAVGPAAAEAAAGRGLQGSGSTSSHVAASGQMPAHSAVITIAPPADPAEPARGPPAARGSPPPPPAAAAGSGAGMGASRSGSGETAGVNRAFERALAPQPTDADSRARAVPDHVPPRLRDLQEEREGAWVSDIPLPAAAAEGGGRGGREQLAPAPGAAAAASIV